MGSVHLCLIHPATRQATQIFSAHPRSGGLPPFCSRPNCEPCLGDGATHPLDANSADFFHPDQGSGTAVRGIDRPQSRSGIGTGWQLPLLEAVARNIAAALRAGEQSEHRRRLALLEERNAIARELHDSLAQSLSYLKIQVSRLQPAGEPRGHLAGSPRHRCRIARGSQQRLPAAPGTDHHFPAEDGASPYGGQSGRDGAGIQPAQRSGDRTGSSRLELCAESQRTDSCDADYPGSAE